MSEKSKDNLENDAIRKCNTVVRLLAGNYKATYLGDFKSDRESNSEVNKVTREMNRACRRVNSK